MTPALVLNHTFLAELIHKPDASRREPFGQLLSTLDHVRSIYGEGTLYVHPDISQTDVGNGQPFVRWANGLFRHKDWNDVLTTLLALCTGPFYTSLPVDEHAAPQDTEPTCQQVPFWLRELVLHSAHHMLSGAGMVWLVSHGDGRHLTEPKYGAERDGGRVEFLNLRNDAETKAAVGDSSRGQVRSALDVLEAAAKHAKRVRICDSARVSARLYGRPPPDNLFDAIVGFDQYALALQSGEGRELAAMTYERNVGVPMSGEKAATLRKPSLKACRMFVLPDGSRKLFDMHAKPGEMRVHVFTRREPIDPSNPNSESQVIVYIGHCGEHLPLI